MNINPIIAQIKTSNDEQFREYMAAVHPNVHQNSVTYATLHETFFAARIILLLTLANQPDLPFPAVLKANNICAKFANNNLQRIRSNPHGTSDTDDTAKA